jgi:hypothetical protein
MLATIRNELIKLLVGQRLAVNWIIADMDVSFCNSWEHSVYVRLKINNLNQVIFFYDLRNIEKDIKKLVKGAWNFTLGSGTLTNPRVGFIVQ